MAKDKKDAPPVRTTEAAKIFKPKFEATNAMSQFFYEHILPYEKELKNASLDQIAKFVNKNNQDNPNWKKISKRVLQTAINNLGNLFGITREKEETYFQFFQRAADTLQKEFAKTGDEITEGVVPENLQELVDEMEYFREEVVQNVAENYTGTTDRMIVHMLEQMSREVEENLGVTDPGKQKEIVLASAAGRQEAFQQATSDLPPGKVEVTQVHLEKTKAKAFIANAVSVQANVPNYTSKVFATAGDIFENYQTSVEKTLNKAGVETTPDITSRIAALTITMAPAKAEEPEKEMSHAQKVISQIVPEREEIGDTTIRDLNAAKTEFLAAGSALHKMQMRMEEKQIPANQAKNLVQQAVEEKSDHIKQKINQLEEKTETEIGVQEKAELYSAAFRDDQKTIDQTVSQLRLSKKDQQSLTKDLTTYSTEFLSTRAEIEYKLTRAMPEELSEVVPDSFKDKLTSHDTTASHLATIATHHAAQGDLTTTSFATKAAFILSVESGDKITGEERDAVDHLVSSWLKDDPTLQMLENKRSDFARNPTLEIYENSMRTLFERTLYSPTGTDTLTQLNLEQIENASPGVIEDTIHIFAQHMAMPQSETARDFLKTGGISLSQLPEGDPIALFDQLEDPFARAAIAADITRNVSPDQLAEQMQVYQDLHEALRETGQEEIIRQNSLFRYLDRVYNNENGIARQVYDSRLYRVYHNFKAVFQPITGFVRNQLQSPIMQKLGQTAIGKGVRAIWARGKGFLQEKLIAPVKKWAFKQVGKKLAKAGVKFATKEGIKAAIAAGGATVSFGITAALWVGEKILSKGLDLLKKGLQRVGFDQAVDKLNQLTSFGLASKLDGLIDKTSILIGDTGAWFVKKLARIGEIITTIPAVTVLGMPLVTFAVIIAIGIPFANQTLLQGLDNMIKTPPIGRGGGVGVTMEEFGLENIEVADIDMSQCLGLSGSAQRACVVTLVIQNCNATQGEVTAGNVSAVQGCFEEAMADDDEINNILSGQVNHIVNAFTTSATTYNVLQCVGYKIGVEPALPGCGDAKYYHPDGCGNCTTISPDNIQSGDNAVWNTGKFGHIAIVIDVDQENSLVYLSQAWGGSGTINFTKQPIIEPTSYINCR